MTSGGEGSEYYVATTGAAESCGPSREEGKKKNKRIYSNFRSVCAKLPNHTLHYSVFKKSTEALGLGLYFSNYCSKYFCTCL